MTSHYGKLYERMSQNKDSIFEPCLIIRYDPEYVTAYVYCLTSQQYRENVPVLFPSMAFNRGMISPPAAQSTGLLFWGADRQAFLMPAQFIPSSYIQKDGRPVKTGSPSLIDNSFTLRNIEGGEHHISSLNGAFMHVKNIGDIELGTPSAYLFRLSESQKSAELVCPRFHQKHRGYEKLHTSSIHDLPVLTEKMYPPRQLAEENSDMLLQAALNGTFMDVVSESGDPYWVREVGKIAENGVAQTSDVDGSALFKREVLKKNNQVVSHQEVSEKGSVYHQLSDDRYDTELTITPGRITMRFTDRYETDPDLRVRVHTFGF